MSNLNLLEDIQHELDNQHKIYQKKDFEVALEGFNNIKPLLLRRDELLHSNDEEDFFISFWTKAFNNFDVTDSFMPFEEGNLDLSWLKCFTMELKDNYTSCIKLELFPNKYIENEVLEKKLGLNDTEVESTQVIWKSNERCGLFQFFDSEECEYEIFDFMYEIYKNGVFYFLIEDE